MTIEWPPRVSSRTHTYTRHHYCRHDKHFQRKISLVGQAVIFNPLRSDLTSPARDAGRRRWREDRPKSGTTEFIRTRQTTQHGSWGSFCFLPRCPRNWTLTVHRPREGRSSGDDDDNDTGTELPPSTTRHRPVQQNLINNRRGAAVHSLVANSIQEWQSFFPTHDILRESETDRPSKVTDTIARRRRRRRWSRHRLSMCSCNRATLRSNQVDQQKTNERARARPHAANHRSSCADRVTWLSFAYSEKAMPF